MDCARALFIVRVVKICIKKVLPDHLKVVGKLGAVVPSMALLFLQGTLNHYALTGMYRAACHPCVCSDQWYTLPNWLQLYSYVNIGEVAKFFVNGYLILLKPMLD